MSKPNLQEIFLHLFKEQENTVSIYLTNGIHLIGSIVDYDNHCVIFSSVKDGRQLIYKHAIATVSEEQ